MFSDIKGGRSRIGSGGQEVFLLVRLGINDQAAELLQYISKKVSRGQLARGKKKEQMI